MGVVNVTPDSFSDGADFLNPPRAIAYARTLLEEGADIIDIGGESTRPGAEPVSADDELARVLPVIEGLADETDRPVISIDTWKASVARGAVDAGARIVNDVTGGRDPEMLRTVAELGAGFVHMHMRGTPKTMATLTHYDDVVDEVRDELSRGIALAREAGISEVYVDPGIGFAKTPQQSCEILGRLSELADLGAPLLVGPSRKSFIGHLTGLPADKRLEGTIAAVVISVLGGASVVRVHDVAAARQAIIVAEAIIDA
ncbi:MAG: dihydropteroate synthase [Gemmatimonadota bacterium]|nr:MAG: dihydropteroate synthase [Gemmatimonadota bacterium]